MFERLKKYIDQKKIKEAVARLIKGVLDAITPRVSNSIKIEEVDGQNNVKVDSIRLTASVFTYVLILFFIVSNLPENTFEIIKQSFKITLEKWLL